MDQHQYVAYYRVSTPRQGRSGLGLDAQREAVRQYLAGRSGKLVAEFQEVRSGRKRPSLHLREALRTCRMRRATLVVARIDRLSRKMDVLARLIEGDVRIAAADFPDAEPFIAHVCAAVADYESRLIAERTKEALAAGRASGRQFGGAVDPAARERIRIAGAKGRAMRRALTHACDIEVAPIAWPLRAAGKSFKAIADELNRRRIDTYFGKSWEASVVRDVLRRTAADFPRLAEAAARGPKPLLVGALARSAKVAPLVWELRAQGLSKPAIAAELNCRQVPTPRGRKWHVTTISKVLERTRVAFAPIAEKAATTLARRRSLNERSRAVAPFAWDLKRRGESPEQIAAALNRLHIPTLKGKRWRGSGIKKILKATVGDFAAIAEAITAAGRRISPPDRLTHARRVRPIIERLRARRKSYDAIAKELNRRNVETLQERRWHASTVRRVFLRVSRSQLPRRRQAA